ncbi:MAG TPA: 3'-5' exonuclease, partial [Dissulfurispiraceae bacterium]
YHFIEVKENYRSLPAIVDFVNTLFGRLMPADLYESWRVEYVPFEATRQGEGRVELLLCDCTGTRKENRKIEAAALARKIKGLRNAREIHEGTRKRPCGYGDMAILLRNRTSLSIFEDALRKEGIPFIVVKGIGFYGTPEIGILKDLLFFLIDPRSDYCLFNILRSPLFSVKYGTLLELAGDVSPDELSIGYLYATLDFQQDLFRRQELGGLRNVKAMLDQWIERAKTTPYAVLLEEILTETGAWRYFHERQRYVNVKKFIKLIEDFEAKGLAGLEIREKLIKASSRSDESKANVNTEGMDAVRIMTAHAAKGLQFPMVFLPCLDEGGQAKTGSIVTDNEGSALTIGYEEDSEARKDIPVFRKHREKSEDEEKRLFYVAATRAMDYLCMSGILGKKPAGKLAYLFEAFQLDALGNGRGYPPFGIEKVTADDIPGTASDIPVRPVRKRAPAAPAPSHEEVVRPGPIQELHEPPAVWRDVTEEVEEIRRKHGDDWVVLGRALHRVFEGLSKGNISAGSLESRMAAILRSEMVQEGDLERIKGIVLSGMERLEKAGYLADIIMPQEHSYAELPFILELGKSVFKGRIDRVIIRDNVAHIYDYKTYPVAESELPMLASRYSFQMNINRKAAERLFSLETKGYLFFTHEPKLLTV